MTLKKLPQRMTHSFAEAIISHCQVHTLRPRREWASITPSFLEEFETYQVNAFHLNSNRKISNNLIGLHFMACIFLFFKKDLNFIF
jgi:hypothetical protein